jgi:Trypsin
MMFISRRLAHALLFIVVLVSACSSGEPSNGGEGTAQQPMVNGIPETDPPGSGVVFLTTEKYQGCGPNSTDGACIIKRYRGSGQLVASDLILTAAHVVDHAVGPSDVTVRRGNCVHAAGNGVCTNTSVEQRTATEVFIHHGWNVGTQAGVDVALVRVSPPFSGGTLRAVTSETTTQTLARTASTCTGYGMSMCPESNDWGILRTAILDPTSLTGNLMHLSPTSVNESANHGDSGGPCTDQNVPGEILGVISEADCGLDTRIIPAQLFKVWYDKVKNAIWTVVADFNGNKKPDTAALVKSGQGFAIQFIYDDDSTPLAVPVPIPFPGFTDAELFAGQFNGDSYADFLLLVDGVSVYFDFNPSTFLSQHTNVTFGTYESFTTSDVNGDGFDDAVATDAYGYHDIYFGSASGLGDALPMGTFPSESDTDGRFLLLTGTNEATLPVPQMSMTVTVPQGETFFSVQIFDGAFPSGYDRGSGDTCYELRADPQGNGNFGSGTLIAQKNNNDFPENAWKSLYTGNVHASAESYTGGPHVYRLDMLVGPCGGAAQAIGGNAVKVRSSAPLSFNKDELSFWARDNDGPAFVGGVPGAYNTKYDGSFTFYVDVTNVNAISLTDADADHTPDDDTLSPLRCDLTVPDVQNNGREIIANDIFYQLYELETGALIATNPNPSGDWWDIYNEFDQECRHFSLPAAPTPGADRFVEWRWSDVLAGNQIHIKVPQTSPTYLRLVARPGPQPRITSAVSGEAWLGRPASAITPLLPIVLGELNACGHAMGRSEVIDSIKEARKELAAFFGPLALVERLEAELLAAKLNMARAALVGDPLNTAFVYGKEISVPDAITNGDHALSHRCLGVFGCKGWNSCGGHGLPPGEHTTDAKMQAAIALLEAINTGHVSYVSPNVALAAAAPASTPSTPTSWDAFLKYGPL